MQKYLPIPKKCLMHLRLLVWRDYFNILNLYSPKNGLPKNAKEALAKNLQNTDLGRRIVGGLAGLRPTANGRIQGLRSLTDLYFWPLHFWHFVGLAVCCDTIFCLGLFTDGSRLYKNGN